MLVSFPIPDYAVLVGEVKESTSLFEKSVRLIPPCCGLTYLHSFMDRVGGLVWCVVSNRSIPVAMDTFTH